MPTYDFRCENCNHTFEEFLSMTQSDDPCHKPCPNCKKKKVVKDFSLPVQTRLMGTPIKHSNAFKDVISKIKNAHPKHNIPDY